MSDDGPELSDAELQSLAPNARRTPEGRWQGTLITDAGEQFGCAHKHATMKEALACARELLAMTDGLA